MWCGRRRPTGPPCRSTRGIAYTGQRPAFHCDGGWLTSTHPDDLERARRAWFEAVGAETDFAHESRFRRFDGVTRWHSFRAEPVPRLARQGGLLDRNGERHRRPKERGAVPAPVGEGSGAGAQFSRDDRRSCTGGVQARRPRPANRADESETGRHRWPNCLRTARTFCGRSSSGSVVRTRGRVPPSAGRRARLQCRPESHRRGKAGVGLPLSCQLLPGARRRRDYRGRQRRGGHYRAQE